MEKYKYHNSYNRSYYLDLPSPVPCISINLDDLKLAAYLDTLEN